MAKEKNDWLNIIHFALNMAKINQRKNLNRRKARGELNQGTDCEIKGNRTRVNNMLTLIKKVPTNTSLNETSKTNYTESHYLWMALFAISIRKKKYFHQK